MNSESSDQSFWNTSGSVRLSDEQILRHAIAGTAVIDPVPLTPEIIYKSFSDTKSYSDSWIKFYMISVALLFLSSFGATSELSIFGAKIASSYISACALVYFSYCTIIYTNYELKIRLYRTYFNGLLGAMQGSARVEVLLRYPLAFIGTEYLAHKTRPEGLTISWGHLGELIPTVLFLYVAKLFAVSGLFALLLYAVWDMYNDQALPWILKLCVIVFLFGSLLTSGRLLRSQKNVHGYQWP